MAVPGLDKAARPERWPYAVVVFLVIPFAALGVALAAGTRGRPDLEATVEMGFGLVIGGVGLIELFRLAAYGPKPTQDRVSQSVGHAGQILFGASLLTAHDTLRFSLLGLAIVFGFAAILKRPRQFFAG